MPPYSIAAGTRAPPGLDNAFVRWIIIATNSREAGMSAANVAALEQPDAADDPALSPAAARRLIRSGEHTGHTAGMAMGSLQGNIVILPKAYALDFANYCHRNPKPERKSVVEGKSGSVRVDLGGRRIMKKKKTKKRKQE